ncbi:FecR domain-containing protein, partial [Oceanispirochaeta sp.]|uniref:FecR domain-containing protein n=1 Tax=Oceanispirochaeta sp. TaxID=2035350 RepID=UPI0026152E84
MKKLFDLMMIFSLSVPVFADVVISRTSGLVEVMKSGSTAWVKAEEGSLLSQNSRISTGFNSTATLLINDASEVTVKALTRIKVEEISGNGSSGDQNTRLFMGAGRINASVKKNESSIHDFRVRTPVSTA